MNNTYAFADESGNNSFDFKSQGTHFVVAAIIVAEHNLKLLEHEIERIRKSYFQTGEMKSSTIANNHQKRIKILNEVTQLPFTTYAVVVNKQELWGEGFKYKKSFYKYLNGLVYKELYYTYPKLILMVDEHGGNDYMKSFKLYVQNNHMVNLFSGSEFEIVNSTNNILIQLADFMAGTIARCYDVTKISDFSNSFKDIIKPKIGSINEFPPKSKDYTPPIDIELDTAYNITIAELSYKKAKDFVALKKSNSQSDVDQINLVKLLTLYFNTYSYKHYIPTHEIMKHLQINRKDEIKERYFRNIIAKLRDEGVLISSNSSDENGYKLPSSINDLKSFLRHGKSVILPMLERIKKCRETIKLATINEIDILDDIEFEELKKILE